MKSVQVQDKSGKIILISKEIIDILIEIHKNRQYNPKNQYFVKPFEYTFTTKNGESITGYVKDTDCEYGHLLDFDEAILLEFPVIKREVERLIKTVDLDKIIAVG